MKSHTYNLFNQSFLLYNSINNITYELQKKMNDFGKSIKDTIIDIKNEKYLSILEYHDKYYENNMLAFYNEIYSINEYCSKNSFSSFDKDFLNSLNNIIFGLGAGIIKYNFDLAYEYLNEAKKFVEDCEKDEDDDIFTFFWVANIL